MVEGRREESRGERLHGTGWGQNDVSCAEEQMERTLGDNSWVDLAERI